MYSTKKAPPGDASKRAASAAARRRAEQAPSSSVLAATTATATTAGPTSAAAAASSKKRQSPQSSEMEIYFQITHLNWPRPIAPEQWEGGVRPQNLYTGGIIAKVQYRSATRRAAAFARTTIKSRDLPYHQPYYLYQCRCEKRQDPKYGPYLQVMQVITCKRQPFNYYSLQWLLRYEVGYSEAEARQAVRPFEGRGNAAIGFEELHPSVMRDVQEKSLYAKQSQLERQLFRWCPESAPLVAHRLAGDSAAQQEKRQALQTLLDEKRPWMLAFKPIAKQCGLSVPLSPARLQRLLSPGELDPVAQRYCREYRKRRQAERPAPTERQRDQQGGDGGGGGGGGENEGKGEGKEGEGEGEIAPLALLSEAIACYTALHAMCKRRGHTVLYPHNVRPAWKFGGPFSPLRFLLDAVGPRLLVEQQVAGRPVFMLARHHRDIETIREALHQMWRRHARVAQPQPMPAEHRLDPEQCRAIETAEREPLLLLAGMPGTGKTYVIEQLVARQEERQPKSTMLCTLTGTMVSGHHERGLALATTIHRPLADLQSAERWVARERDKLNRVKIANRQYERAVHKLEAVRNRLANVEWLLIDEFSNVDLALFARILTLCPALTNLVLIYDRWQTPPVDPGSPCLELERAFAQSPYRVQLERNYRTRGTAAHQLVENDRRILRLDFDGLDLQTIRACSTEIPAHWPALDGERGVRPGCYLVEPSERGLPHDIAWINATFCPNQDSRQILTLMHEGEKGRLELNLIVDRQQQQLGVGGGGGGGEREAGAGGTHHQHHQQQQNSWTLYSGQRISVRDCNFKAVARVDLERAAGLRAEEGENGRGGGRGGGKGRRKRKEEEGEEEREGSSSSGGGGGGAEFRSDAFHNHEVFLFDHCQDYDVRRKRWSTHRLRRLASRDLARPPSGHVRFLRTRCGHQFCLHDEHVRPEKMEVAWTQTVNSFQGREEVAIVFPLPEDPKAFTIHHLHVAASRAKECLVFYGIHAQLQALGYNQIAPRQSVLGYLLKQSVGQWGRTAKIPSGFLDVLRQ